MKVIVIIYVDSKSLSNRPAFVLDFLCLIQKNLISILINTDLECLLYGFSNYNLRSYHIEKHKCITDKDNDTDKDNKIYTMFRLADSSPFWYDSITYYKLKH